VVTEALASGLVVMAYDYAATRQHIVHGRNGYSARFADKQALLETAVSAMHQRDLWPALRREARATAQSITWDAIVNRFEWELSRTINTGAGQA
jgi:glycosyltransferase involved in cell wall biosynthesis